MRSPTRVYCAGLHGICKLMFDVGLAGTNSEARRLIERQSRRKRRREDHGSPTQTELKAGDSFVLKAGKKKFVRVKVN